MKNRLWWVLPLVLVVSACSRCGSPGGGGATAKAELARLLPKNAEAIILVPDLAKLGERLTVLERLKIANFAAQLQGVPTAKELSNSVGQLIGVDLRNSEDLKAAGLDSARGLALVMLQGQQGYSVMAVDDAKKLRSRLEGLTRDRLGVTKVETQEQGGFEVSRFMGPRGEEAAMLVRDGYAIVAARPASSRILELANLPAGTSLADEPGFAKGQARLPKDRHLVGYIPTASTIAAETYLHGATIAATLADDALKFVIDVPWPDTRASLAALDKKDGPSPYGVLPQDAFMVARFSGDFAALDGLWPYVTGQRMAQVITEGGLDVKKDVLSNLSPGGVLSVSLSPIVNFTTGLSLNVRRSNPFRMAHVVAAAKVKDPAKAAATLEKVPAISPKLGATVTAEDRAGQKVYLTEYSQGEGLHFALAGDTFVAASPQPRLLDGITAAKAQGGGDVPLSDPELKKALEGSVFAFVVDLQKLAEQVKALPSSAWGVGGFAIKATTIRWLEATDDLKAITGNVSSKDGALQAELQLRIAAK